jgi:hypothetical protein
VRKLCSLMLMHSCLAVLDFCFVVQVVKTNHGMVEKIFGSPRGWLRGYSRMSLMGNRRVVCCFFSGYICNQIHWIF